MVQQQHWEAPIPPPALLEQYGQIMPNGANRIMLMAEAEGRNTRHVQTVAVWGTFIGQSLGQIFAFLIAGGCVYTAFRLAMAGHDGVAAILGGTTLSTIVLAFLQSKGKSKK